MTDFAKLTFEEQKAVNELQTRLKKALSPEMYDDSTLFYRFLKARDFDIGKAEVMLKKHLKWRKVFQVDTILETLKPKEVFKKYFTPQFIGFDKDGDIVIYAPVGSMDSRDALKCMKVNDFEKHCIYNMEESKALLNEENEKTGRNRHQGTFIINLDQLTIANATSKASAEFLIRASRLLQDNYPERLKAIFVINAPSYYVFVHSILKKMMSNAMVQKIHVFGRNGWKEEFLKLVSANVLPACLGGNRMDPDGNPLCLTFMNHGGRVPSKYHLRNDERWFKDRSLVKKTIVSPLSKNIISVDVKQYGSLIQWEFECKSQDIEFGLFFHDNEHQIEVLPMHRYITPDGTETGSYKAKSVGKSPIHDSHAASLTFCCTAPSVAHFMNFFVVQIKPHVIPNHVVFDNSYSWLSSKEVHYTVIVVNPDS